MIDILPSEEQTALVDPLAKAVIGSDTVAPDAKVQFEQAAKLGCFGMALAENVGGSGLSIADEALFYRALGYHLATPDILATTLAAHLAASQDDQGLTQQLLNGSRRVAFLSRLKGILTDDGLQGDFHLLSTSGDTLGLFLSPEGCALVDSHAFEDRHAVTSVDDTFGLTRVRGPATPLIQIRDDSANLWRRACLLFAAQLSGIAEAVLDRAVAYAKIREQFGRPIGAFQAVAHHCADMALRSELTTAQLYFAAIAVRDDRDDAPLQVAAACLTGAEAAQRNATMAIRVHGGMGYSAESGLHIFLKRGLLLRHLAGGDDLHASVVLNAR